MLQKLKSLSPTNRFCVEVLGLASASLVIGIFNPLFIGSEYYGCLVVLFSVMAEYRLLSDELKRLRLDTMELGSPIVFSQDDAINFDRYRDKIEASLTRWAHVMVVLGTLLWGFGDKINY